MVLFHYRIHFDDSEGTQPGSIQADYPVAALERTVTEWQGPERSIIEIDLFPQNINTDQLRLKMIARYLGSRAATEASAPDGEWEWIAGELYVGKELDRDHKHLIHIPKQEARYELVEN